MTEALRGVGRGHTWRSYSLSSLHENLYAMEMLPREAIGSSTLVYDTIRRRTMNSTSGCRGTAEAGFHVVERGEEAMTSSVELNYPKSKVSVRKEVDTEECHSAVEADLPIVKEGMRMQGNE
ncbi:hypothetical protein BHE74_00037965 [Ensete ventricosum]|nr:hypothetical protein BHE74_00037965 [Ensete ventricosum]